MHAFRIMKKLQPLAAAFCLALASCVSATAASVDTAQEELDPMRPPMHGWVQSN